MQHDQRRPALVVDANGLATGSIRTGHIFDAGTLARLYPGGKAEYLERFAAATDSAIAAGFILPAHRAEIVALSDAQYP